MFELVLANLVGLAGFIVLAIAPLTATRARFLALDVAGLVPVAIHYVLLGSPAGAAFCVLYIVMDLIGFFTAGGPRARTLYWLVYPAAAVILALGWSGWGDLLATAGTMLAAAARQQTHLPRLKLLVFASALGWGAFGALTLSWSQVAFSTVYAISALIGARRDSLAMKVALGAPELAGDGEAEQPKG
ncbi:MAG: YgjV family protein [Maricaulaceae bacterium]